MMTLEEGTTSDQSQIIPPEADRMHGKRMLIITVCVVLTSVLALIAIILSFIGVGHHGDNQYNISVSAPGGASSGRGQWSGASNEDRIWVFQIGHFGSNTQYLDEASGTIRGYDVDVVNAVCQLANKNCVLVWDLYERCWDSQAGQRPRGGIGLMGDWYDGCIGWVHTIPRKRTYIFTREIERVLLPAFWVKAGETFSTYPNFSGKTVGFLDGWWIDEHCLNRYDGVTGFDANDPNQVVHFQVEDDVIDALVKGEIDTAFLPKVPYLVQHADIEIAFPLDTDKCAVGGAGIMLPKKQFELVTWFNAAFDRLVGSSQYRDICENLKEDHGNVPGAEPSEICIL